MEQAFPRYHRRKHITQLWTVTVLSSVWETCDGMTWISCGTFVGIKWKEVISISWKINLDFKNLSGNRRQRKSRIRRRRQFADHATQMPTVTSSRVLLDYAYTNQTFSSLSSSSPFLCAGDGTLGFTHVRETLYY